MAICADLAGWRASECITGTQTALAPLDQVHCRLSGWLQLAVTLDRTTVLPVLVILLVLILRYSGPISVTCSLSHTGPWASCHLGTRCVDLWNLEVGPLGPPCFSTGQEAKDSLLREAMGCSTETRLSITGAPEQGLRG